MGYCEYAWENLTTLDATFDNIDENRVMGIVRVGIREGRMPETALEETSASLLNRWGLIANGKPTNGALALFAKDAGNYSQFRLQMAKFKGTDSIEFLDNQQLKGNIFEQLDGAMAFCFKHLNLSGKVVGLKREEELEIPYEALREGVINALCHRRYDDYREGLQLGIYNDRVEICNPGRFPTGVTPENIKTLHSSKPRNLHIAQVMYKAAYLEGWGTGIKRMIDVCKAHNLPEPFYQIWADGTIVLTFMRPKTAKNGETNGETNSKWESLTERQNSIIQCLQKNGTHTSRTLSVLLDISQRTVEREISFLRKNGFIDKVTCTTKVGHKTFGGTSGRIKNMFQGLSLLYV